MGGGTAVGHGVAVCLAVAVAGAEGLELLERLGGGGARAALWAAAIRVVMRAVIEAVIAEEGGGDFGGGGEIVGVDPAAGGGASLAEALPAPQLREADEADAI